MILRAYIFAVMIIIIGSLVLPVPQELFVYGISYLPAFAYTALCASAFLLGYFLFYTRAKSKNTSDGCAVVEEYKYITLKVMLFLLVTVMSGVLVLAWQIYSTVGIIGYLDMLSGASSVSGNSLRDSTIFVSYSTGGGLPGWLKVFNWNSVIAPFCLLILRYRGYRIRGFASQLLTVLIMIFYLLGIMLRVDRLSILAVVPVLLSLMMKRDNGRIRANVMIGFSLLILGIIFQSIRRAGSSSLIDVLALYIQLGIVNLAVLMRANFVYTLGFNSIFSQTAWLLKGLGVNAFAGSTLDIPWPRDPAMNGFGYWFQDFGWYGSIVFLFVGMLAQLIDKRANDEQHTDRGGVWKTVQWVATYGVLSIPVVPSYGSPEFWLMLFLSPVLVEYLTNFLDSHLSNVGRFAKRKIFYDTALTDLSELASKQNPLEED